MGTGGYFPGSKARPGRDADHSPLSNAAVKNEELYLLSHLAPAWRVAGQLYSLYIFLHDCDTKHVGAGAKILSLIACKGHVFGGFPVHCLDSTLA
jgi:hypothetical protein